MPIKAANSKYFYVIFFILFFQGVSSAQKVKWMNIGSLQDWYSDMGCERELGTKHPLTGILTQQTGWMWPADHDYMDCQAWKGLWIGTKNFMDKDGVKFPYKVVEVGPRVQGIDEFFPVKFYLKSKFPKPEIKVDGKLSLNAYDTQIDSVDPSMAADREIVSVVNTQLGLTLTRHIFQFSQQFNDNYIVTEYTLTNTGDTDSNPATIELPNQTLDSVQMFLQYRLAPSYYSRYAIGNATGWGINTTYDTRGDGIKPDPAGEQLRAQFAWHGYFPNFTLCNNIGGPVWFAIRPITPGDTIGRLTSFQFVGVVTLHADKSVSDRSDDPGQPTTTSTFSSDDPLNAFHDPANQKQIAAAYAMMTTGHDKRYLDKMGETDLSYPTKDPSLGTGGGYSMGNGFGPYTLKPGESIRIIIAQASAGMGWEGGEKIGRQYKTDLMNGMDKKAAAVKKNIEVMKGKDSLMTTFRRALDGYNKNWTMQLPPAPPASINVNSMADRIAINWKVFNESDPELQGFQIWRASGKADSTYRLVAELPASARSYDDKAAAAGVDYYYRIITLGKLITADPAQNIPATRLVSSKFYGQTYLPARIKEQSGAENYNDKAIAYQLKQNYPNPFNPETVIEYTLSKESYVRLSLLNILGQEVKLLVDERQNTGTHRVRLNAEGLSSGTYFYKISAAENVSVMKCVLLK